MRFLFACCFCLLPTLVFAQADPLDPVPPQSVTPMAVTYAPFPAGMRVIVGSAGILVRNTPSLSGTCGEPPHACTTADAIQPNVYGVIQNDAPVLDAGGTFYWERVTFDTGPTGWVTVSGPDRLASLNPPQMVSGVSFAVAGDYNGPALTQGECNVDGIASAATLNLQPVTGGQQGTLVCPINKPGVGNHKVAITARNLAGSATSAEFQFSVTTVAVPQRPNAPANLRITPTSGSTPTQLFDDAVKGVKPGAPGAPSIEKKE